MPDRSTTLAALALILSGCATARTVPAGQSLADDRLQADTLRTIKHYEMARMLNGEPGVTQTGMPAVVSVRVLEPPPSTGPRAWRELWTIRRATGTVDYRVKYIARADIGGTDMVVTPADMPPPVRPAIPTP